MGIVQPLNPTAWRTFRVLANGFRLELLKAVIEKPGRSVKDYALELELTPNLAGKYLRELQARGVLSARRRGRCLLYSPGPNPTIPFTKPLYNALKKALIGDQVDTTRIIWALTAYTHPRRMIIVLGLAQTPMTSEDLLKATGISGQALPRHLDKLQRREIVVEGIDDQWHLVKPDGKLSEALLQIVFGEC